MSASRREFIGVVGRLVVVSCVPLVGCDDDSGPAPDSGLPRTDGGRDDAGSSGDGGQVSCETVGSSIGSNHPTPHVLDTVTEEDVSAGAEKSYTLSTSGAHSHAITLDAAAFAALLAGESIQRTSTLGGGHTHVVTLMCV